MKYIHFEEGHLYHVFNQGNNSRKVFFTSNNYNFFLRNLQRYLSPHASIIAWCLIHNQFDLLIKVDHLFNSSNRILNDSIGVLLRSYSRSINRQQRFTGSLFQQGTKALCLDDSTESAYSFYFSKAAINPDIIFDIDLIAYCMRYIHFRPVRAGLAYEVTDWPYSSFGTYFNSKTDSLLSINQGIEIFKQSLKIQF